MCLERYDYDVDSYDVSECSQSEEANSRLSSASDCLVKLLNLVYTNKHFTSFDFEYVLEDLCSILDVELPSKAPNISCTVDHNFILRHN